jgi:hypothetical protein
MPQWMWWRFVAAALPLALSTHAAAAEPAAPQFALSVVRLPGAERCASTASTALAVERLLGRPAFVAPAGASVSIEGSVAWSESDAAFYARVAISDAKGVLLGTRELTNRDPTCKDLDTALALALALFIDPTAALSSEPAKEPAPAPPPDLRHDALTAPAPVTSAASPSAASPRDHVVVTGALGVTLASGLLPDAAPGGVAKLAASPDDKWFVSLDAALFAEERASARASGAASFSLASATLAVCPTSWRRGRFAVRPCIGFLAGMVAAHGVRDGELSTRHRPLYAPTARLDLSLRFLRNAFFALSPTLVVPTERDSFDAAFDGQVTTIFRPSAIGGTLDLSIGVKAP